MQKKNDYQDRLKVSIEGVDNNAYKMMVSYLEVCCKEIAVVEGSESQAEIIDIDLAHSKTILKERLAQKPSKPIIVLSIQDVLSDDAIYVKKPVEAPDLVEAIKVVKKKLQRQNKQERLLIQKPEKIEALNKNSEPIMTTAKSSYEINNLLDSFLDGDSFDFFGSSPIEAIQNRRKTVRYGIHSIKAKLKRNSFFASKKTLIVWVLNVSSKGALIEIKTAVKLKGKVTLTIYFDPQHIFSVPAQVVRAEKESIYGLQFSSYQHELADYLVDNGHLFSIV